MNLVNSTEVAFTSIYLIRVYESVSMSIRPLNIPASFGL